MTSKFKRNKKGQGIVLDLVVWMVVVIVLVIIAIVLSPIFTDIKDSLVADPDFNDSSQAVAIITESEDRFPDIMDAITLTVLFFLAVGVVVASFLIDTHPIFFVFAIIIFVVISIIAGIFSETWVSLMEDSNFATVPTDFPITNWVMNNFLVVVLAYAPLIILSLFARSRLQ